MYLQGFLGLNSAVFLYAFLLLILIAALLPLILGVSQLGMIRKLSHLVLAALNHCEFRIGQLEGCQMENLPLIRQLIAEENYPQLSTTFAEFERDSQKLFHDKWTADLRPYFDREHLLTQNQYHRFTPDWSYRILAVGLLSAAFFLLLSLTLGGDFQRIGLPISLAPALTGTLFFFLTYYRADNARKELDRSMHRLAETATLRLPAFSDLAGSAVLVDAFMQYDRRMEASVAQLSQTVGALLNNQMVEAVSQSILTGIQANLLPPLQESHRLLASVTADLEQRQEQGMRQLADQFTNQATDLLARRMEVFFRELDHYLAQLRETKGEVAQSLATLDQYREQASLLDRGIQQNLLVLQEQNAQSVQYLEQLSTNQERLANTSERLADLQTGSTNSLSSLVGDLGQQVTGFAQSMTELTQGIRDENRAHRQAIDVLMDSQKKNIEGYQQLSETMVTGGQSLNRQADLIHRQLETLNNQLNQSVQTFQKSLTQTVSQVVDTFDAGLADVTDRLSSTTGEIREVADNLRVEAADLKARSADKSRE